MKATLDATANRQIIGLANRFLGKDESIRMGFCEQGLVLSSTAPVIDPNSQEHEWWSIGNEETIPLLDWGDGTFGIDYSNHNIANGEVGRNFSKTQWKTFKGMSAASIAGKSTVELEDEDGEFTMRWGNNSKWKNSRNDFSSQSLMNPDSLGRGIGKDFASYHRKYAKGPSGHYELPNRNFTIQDKKLKMKLKSLGLPESQTQFAIDENEFKLSRTAGELESNIVTIPIDNPEGIKMTGKLEAYRLDQLAKMPNWVLNNARIEIYCPTDLTVNDDHPDGYGNMFVTIRTSCAKRKYLIRFAMRWK